MPYPPSIKNYIDPESKFGGILFINSSERYITLKIKQELRELVKSKDETKLIFYDMAEDKDAVSETVNTAREIGFFCSRKIVVLELSSKLSDRDSKILENYIDTSEQSNVVIVFISEIDKRTKLFKSVRQMKNIYFSIPEPKSSDIRQFVRQEFKPFKTDDRVEDFFVNSPDRDLFYFHNEIEKIKLYAESRKIEYINYERVKSVLTALESRLFLNLLPCFQREKNLEHLNSIVKS